MPVDRDKLAKELVKLRKVYAPYEGRDAEICSVLKQDAADNGGNFQVVVDKQGKVKVSAPHGKAPKGETWELDLDAWINKTTQAERARLMDKGLIKRVTEYSGAYYGAVTVELF
jgi:hypothetical protein